MSLFGSGQVRQKCSRSGIFCVMMYVLSKKKFQPNQTRARPKNKYLTSSHWEMCNRLPIYTIFSLQ